MQYRDVDLRPRGILTTTGCGSRIPNTLKWTWWSLEARGPDQHYIFRPSHRTTDPVGQVSLGVAAQFPENCLGTPQINYINY